MNAACRGVLVAVVAASTGCATLTGTKTETMSVNSIPPGAEVRVNGSPAGVTPTQVELDKQRRNTVQVLAPGYLPGMCRASMSPAGGYIAADVALCLLLCPFTICLSCLSFVDATGAWNELDHPDCTVQLAPDTGQYQQAPPGEYQAPPGYQPPPPGYQAPPPGYVPPPPPGL